MLRSLLFLAMSAALWAEGSKPTPGLTVVLDVKGASVSNQTLTEMQVEIRNILKETGLQVDFKFRTELLPEESFEDLILVQFKGRCEMDQQPVLFDERGPMALAYTHTIEGGILPFSTVLCDQLKTSIRAAMWGEDFKRGNLILGRAIGRVLSHEFFHILANTSGHGKDGIARRSLSAAQLIADHLNFNKFDANLLRMRARQPQPEATLQMYLP